MEFIKGNLVFQEIERSIKMGYIGKRQKRPRLPALIMTIFLTILFFLLILFILLSILKEEPKISEEIPKPVQTITETEDDTFPQVTSENTSFTRKEKCYTFLIAASDQSSGNADTIMVITFDTKLSKVGIVSIPRDTLIDPDDGYSSYPKINSTYLKGINNLKSAVSNLLGIPIDFYVTIDVDGFVELVDSVGGIDFDIPVHMSYDDPKQNLHIHFEPGMTHLNGSDALKVCRLRDNNDGTLAYPDYDIGRTRTQQQILIAIGKKVLMNPQNISEYIGIFNQYVKTNLTFRYALWFVDSLMCLNLDQDITVSTLPGDGSVSYKNTRYCYELDQQEAVRIVNELLLPYTTLISSEDMNIFSVKNN